MGNGRSGKVGLAITCAIATVALAVPGTQAQDQGAAGSCQPGAPGVGDPDYPGYGNGGYDVRHYGLDIAYAPGKDQVDGEAAIRAHATQNLCSFNLDLVGLNVKRIDVDGERARFGAAARS